MLHFLGFPISKHILSFSYVCDYAWWLFYLRISSSICPMLPWSVTRLVFITVHDYIQSPESNIHVPAETSLPQLLPILFLDGQLEKNQTQTMKTNPKFPVLVPTNKLSISPAWLMLFLNPLVILRLNHFKTISNRIHFSCSKVLLFYSFPYIVFPWFLLKLSQQLSSCPFLL